MKIKVGVGSLRNYKRIEYKLWQCLAELCDNSIQAYFDSKKDLDKVYEKNKTKLTINITYDKEMNSLKVTDTSAGITEKKLTEAFDVGSATEREDAENSLGEFNVGLKSAAIWLCDIWTLDTKRYSEKIQTSVIVDNEQIFTGNDDLETSQKDVDNGNGYTRLSFESLNHVFTVPQLNEAKLFLASTYRNWLNKSIIIIFNGEELEWVPFNLHPNPDNGDKPYKWSIGPGYIGPKKDKTVSGWIGILHTGLPAGHPKKKMGSGLGNAGISIMRRGRMIQGYPKAWRPESIFASGAGSTLNQRLVGELVFDDGKVSHTKASVHDDDLKIMERYLDEFVKQNGIAKIAKTLAVKVKVTKDKEEEAKDELNDLIPGTDLGTIARQPIANPEIITQRIDGTFAALPKDQEIVFNLGNYMIKMYPAHNGEDKPYAAYKKIDKIEFQIIVNLDHPYLTQNSFVNLADYYVYIILEMSTRFKIERDARLTMDDYFEVKDTLMRFKLIKN